MPAFLFDPVVKYYISAAVAFYPVMRIFRRAGFSPLGALLLLVPFFGYVLAAAALTARKWPVLAAPRGEA
jgi:hypothetical protein